MATLKSLFKFIGSMGDFTAYERDEVTIIQRKGGFSKERIHNDPKLFRIRQSNQEFARQAGAAKQIKTSFIGLSRFVDFASIIPRLTQVFYKIKNLDLTPEPGQRTVGNGLSSDEGKEILKNFQFNEDKRISNVLLAKHHLDIETGTVTIPLLNARRDIIAPKSADKVCFQAHWATIDFDAKTQNTVQSNPFLLSIETNTTDINLQFDSIPKGNGVQIYVLSIQFFQTINGIDYPLNDKAYNVADVIEVIDVF